MTFSIRHALNATATAAVMSSIMALGAPAHGADDVSDGQWYLDYLNIAAVHKITQGEGVKIAVIDTGIDPTHPDLQGSVFPGADFSTEGPGEGLTDADGHGTSMASLIVGHGRIKGVAPKATVVSVKVSAGGPIGGRGSMGSAILWAIAHGIKILSISSSNDESDLVTEQAIQEAVANDIVVVAAAGNKPGQNTIGYPARYPGVLTVSGLSKNGELSDASVIGPQVSVAAPSDDISTAFRDQRRVVGTGTSNSTALTAGAVAILWAKYPDLSAAEIVHRLTATATDKGAAGRDAEYGFGALNLVAALTADVPPLQPQGTSDPSANESGSSSLIAAPGTEFPAGIAIVVGLVCLLVVVIAIVLAVVLTRRRR